jgi:molecular chaperone GrpE
MNDAIFSHESTESPPPNGDDLPREEVPQFGAIDIVEAFTAMRHEWRSQTKESRAVVEQIQSAVTNIQSLESKLRASVTERRSDGSTDLKPLVLLIVETDHQLSRAVAAIAQWEATRQTRAAADAVAIEQCVAAMNKVARWFARPLLTLLAAQRSAVAPIGEHPALEGLNMVLGRLRRMMREQGIERLDVQGQPFDANTMCAIGAMPSTDCPAGHVAEQLSPVYVWQGKLLRFADVRVAS